MATSRFRRHHPSQSAFTVLELLVVTAIIGALIGLLLPALLSARESARSIQCLNNLREIGLATQVHHNATNRLPAAWTITSDGVSGFGWSVALLPYLEQNNLYSSIQGDRKISAPENDLPRNTSLEILCCPSDIQQPTFQLFAENGGPPISLLSVAASAPESALNTLPLTLPTANYLGVFGTLEADDSYPPPPGDGAIIGDRTICYANLERGQSYTLIVGERTMARVPSTWYGVDFRGEDAACRLVGSAITSPNCSDCDECEFDSRHRGGSNFLLADGHAIKILSNIDTHEYQRLAKRRIE